MEHCIAHPLLRSKVATVVSLNDTITCPYSNETSQDIQNCNFEARRIKDTKY